MTVLSDRDPRILGGRDHLAGGTWLAVSENGVMAALTNRAAARHDATKRSRGEWPIFLARYERAAAATQAFVESHPPHEFNPGWIFVGDGRDLFYIDMTGGDRGRVVELQPGAHILENRPMEVRSPKVDLVRSKLAGIEAWRGAALNERLRGLLASHDTPDLSQSPADDPGDSGGWASRRPAASLAPCVHLAGYGTRSSTIAHIRPGETPEIWSSDGPPCTASFVESTGSWVGEPPHAERSTVG